MLFVQNRNPEAIIANKEMPFILLAESKGIEISINKSPRISDKRFVEDKFLMEFIILMGRIINGIEKGSQIIFFPYGKYTDDSDVWCAMDLSNYGQVNIEELTLGLKLDITKIIGCKKLTLNISYPKETYDTGKNAQKRATVDLNSSIYKPFFTSLHASLKGDYNTSTDFLKDASISSKEDGKFLEKVNNFILSNLSNERFDSNELCKLMMSSRSRLYRKMRKLVKRSPAMYIRQIRLENAKQMLERTNKSIGDIAFEVGYPDHSHFTRSFKKYFGFYPSYHRQKCKE